MFIIIGLWIFIWTLVQFFYNWIHYSKEDFFVMIKHYFLRALWVFLLFALISYFTTWTLWDAMITWSAFLWLFGIFYSAAYSWYRTENTIQHKYIVSYLSEGTFIITLLLFCLFTLPSYITALWNIYVSIIAILCLMWCIYIYYNKKILPGYLKFIFYTIYNIIIVLITISFVMQIIQIWWWNTSVLWQEYLIYILGSIVLWMNIITIWSSIWQYVDFLPHNGQQYNDRHTKQYQLLIQKVWNYQITKRDLIFIVVYIVLLTLRNYTIKNPSLHLIIYLVLLILLPLINIFFLKKTAENITYQIEKNLDKIKNSKTTKLNNI